MVFDDGFAIECEGVVVEVVVAVDFPSVFAPEAEFGLFEAVVVFLAEFEGPAHLVGFEDEGAPN